jgi:predicted dithiol-disulfide oxidoreductase (DUF899 family)
MFFVFRIRSTDLLGDRGRVRRASSSTWHDVTLSVSRAPIAKLQEYQRRMGWTFPRASSLDSDFNVWFTEEP